MVCILPDCHWNKRYLSQKNENTYLIPFKFRLPLIFASRGAEIEGNEFQTLKTEGSDIKTERIREFCIEMFVSLKGGKNWRGWNIIRFLAYGGRENLRDKN